MRCCRCELCWAEFDLPAILVNCYTASPVAPTCWYDEWVVRYYDNLAKDGVAVTTYASVLESVAAAAEATQPEPRLTLGIKPKTFGPAMRQARLLLHSLSLPSACGADLFSSSIVGQCPPCAGYVLRSRSQAASTAAASAAEQRSGGGAAERRWSSCGPTATQHGGRRGCCATSQ